MTPGGRVSRVANPSDEGVGVIHGGVHELLEEEISVSGIM
jgi:hypothetical protein